MHQRLSGAERGWVASPWYHGGVRVPGVGHPGKGHLTWSLLRGHPMSLHDDRGVPPCGIRDQSGQPPRDVYGHPLTSGPGGPVCPGGPCRRKEQRKAVRARGSLNRRSEEGPERRPLAAQPSG